MGRIRSLLRLFGIDLQRPFRVLPLLPRFIREYFQLKKQLATATDFSITKFYPCLDDYSAESGRGRGDYFHQDLLVARKIFLNNPVLHVDIGSRIDGFVAHVASFRTIEVIDIRPFSNTIHNIAFVQLDLMGEIPANFENYCDSLSCLHSLEHFGLGRYNDPINANGHIDGLKNMSKFVKPGGKFYLSVPIGPQRIEFNAHRVFSVTYLLSLVKNDFQIDTFSYVDDRGDLFENVELEPKQIQTSFGCRYGCGILELTKLPRRLT